MTTTNPPEFYFTGIQYNPEFYVSTSTSPGITQTVGDSRYLIKTQSDSTSASAIETFNGGIKTSSIDTPTAGTLTLGGTNCTGITFSDNISSLTLANNQFITPNTGTTYSATNGSNIVGTIGYVYNQAIQTPASGALFSSGVGITYGSLTVPSGVYMATAMMTLACTAATTWSFVQSGIEGASSGNLYHRITQANLAGTYYYTISGMIITTASTIINCTMYLAFSGTQPTVSNASFKFSLVRIA